MGIIVQKFGGTSVIDQEARSHLADRVKEAVDAGLSPVVVVSAMGRAGDPYATDTLRSLPLSVDSDMPLREMDLIMACGEIISAVVTAATLNQAGLKARVFTGGQAGIVCDGNYGNAEVKSCDPKGLTSAIERGEIPVVAGFQGATAEGEINTLGRGGSDTTAVILGAATGADRVEIYTDVSGIMTADPRMVSTARLIDRLSYGEVVQMAYEGAKVIHPRAVEVAMQNGVKLVIKNPRDNGAGTLITSAVGMHSELMPQGRRVVTGIAHTLNLAQISIDLPVPDPQIELAVFERLAAAGINVDLINVFPHLKVFTVSRDSLERSKKVLDQMSLTYRVEAACAKVSVVGVGMRNIPGVMARVVKALVDQNIEILQTSDSNITISLLVRQADLAQALTTLHDYFQLEKDNITTHRWAEDLG